MRDTSFIFLLLSLIVLYDGYDVYRYDTI